MNRLSVRELFDIDGLWYGMIFESVIHPWNALVKIKEFIEVCDKRSFSEYSQGVYISKNVKIHSSAVIIPPCIIAEGTEIRPSAYLRGAVITGKNCVIGNSTEIKNSLIMDSVQLPHYNYVGDSVLGNKTHMGAGSICSNLKSDGSDVTIHGSTEIATNLRKLGSILGDGVEIGCNCVLKPGTVVCKNTTVYPMNSVRGVVPENSIYKSADTIVSKIQE